MKSEELRQVLLTRGYFDYKEFDYLLRMHITAQTMDVYESYLAECRRLKDQLHALQMKTPTSVWMEDLDKFEAALNEYRNEREKCMNAAPSQAFKKGKKRDVGSSSSSNAKKISKADSTMNQD
jgi:hypothetical protein